ncbi:hypothetical protein ACDI89_18005 [Mycobacteroides abscessus]|uniref:hypothetical protein n=1 Tax=Mycobacteroides abscessus TaxID=36809 RepID=UPI0009A57087|nr:hypothetical protein [Mycobacteroides abscessus]MBN7468644.1 hypothetical protein [Mycobacteroides abscessus subsp. massiliense]QSM02865.1 hypothetical protein PROPHIGD58-1_35 [Mycobacterium phage prophi58-1]SLD29442.1 Uncharacterised protein [Mycobacteroides abscessus subsp. massiliense]SLD39446.1 Uncharacterised protein [Mycobacteroides abscessus subsp. massiliense]
MKTTTPAQAPNGTGRWEVRIKPKPDPDQWLARVPTVVEAYLADHTRFVVKSPRGAEIFTSRNQSAAMTVARSLASVDELLARVNRLEHTAFGQHPALRAPMVAPAPRRRGGALRIIQDPHA